MNTNKLKVMEMFSGVGSQRMSLMDIGIEHEVVATSEVSKFAIRSYSAIHCGLKNELESGKYDDLDVKKAIAELKAKGVVKVPKNAKQVKELYVADKLSKNLGDVSKLNMCDIPNHDLLTYSPPCQDISTAGLQKGIIKGETRSGLFHDALEIIKHKQPKYAIGENVTHLLSKRFKKDFEGMLDYLSHSGYNNYWGVLNAKHFGIPQNRERIFIVSIRKDVDSGNFKMPKGCSNDIRLIDILEESVSHNCFIDDNRKLNMVNPPQSINSKESTLRFIGGIESNKRINNGKELSRNYKEGYRVYDPRGIATTQNASGGGLGGTTGLYMINGKIRKLSPKESWRLMGFKDECIDRCMSIGISNSQLYKQSGNSIVVGVLDEIFKSLLK